ncbi:polyphosphate polymerase domain-containing protein [Streptomonospora wellingtoniae]|uniref:Polyphosphate polymerase domain-containing protein n=1 Tax=Streptomonospora wellingtoniae TaxID=3075544 RepID=A0ABU2KNN2_9ACTN|nr:polyphosphate polymerase domain-containing protein [Streptomonospora sp. DSM 45055]MDT0300867.1 polyphosphate polymerase domain-containing protein [Streptomonospora sp. DSM 45055]
MTTLRPGPEAPGTGDATAGEPGAAEAGHRFRAPSRLHAFNRYELKYLVPVEQVGDVRAELTARMESDANAGPDGYGVWSLYYDTRRLRFYWEKIEGLKFRRKLRIRRYGETGTGSDDTMVSVEIKQRVNRVTQKRRVLLPYGDARALCDRRRRVEHPRAQPFVDEVLDLLHRLDLRPSAMTGYRREPYVGTGADLGLRVTLDHRVRGRDRDFDVRAEAESRYIISPRYAVMEVKANERAPYWITDMAARHGLQVQRISKYCQSVEAFGKAPRSVFHVPEEDPVGESRPMSAPQPWQM